MANKMLIDATHPEETRVVVLRGNRVEEFDFETAHRKQLRGNIYLAKVTRVEPSLQAAFVEYGGNRHGFLAFSEIHPDYYQIPVADRQALLDEERRAQRAEDDDDNHHGHRRHGRRRHYEARRRDRPDQALRSEEQQPAGEEPAQDAAESSAAENISGFPSNEELAREQESANQPVESGTDETPAHADAAHDDRHGEAPEGLELIDPARDLQFDAQGPEGADAQAGEAAVEAAIQDDIAPEASPLIPAEATPTEGGAPEEAAEEEVVESVGGADAMEEVPDRAPRYRRQYKIQEVIKRRQVLLVQVVKEERGTKGAALTTYLSLAGRYCVLMPNTARGGGISRKITSAEDRKRLREIADTLQVPEGMGVILRTAGANRNAGEVERDFEYLLRQWELVRDLTLKSTAPTLVYEEGSLVKRSIRDLYGKEIDEIVVAGEGGYQEARDFLGMLMPSHESNVKLYRDGQPIFTRYGIESQLDAMFSPVVQLKSGGYIVINQTEALVSIDVNSGRSTREHHIEDTALKTNVEAAEEIARQLRLRDLAGLIVIDFIDMDEKRNNRTVERRLKDALRHDRARIQVGRISHFGLLEMSRQRIRTSVLESSTEKCPMCGGTGHMRSVSSVALQLLRSIEETILKGATHNLIARTRPEVALYVLNHKRAHLRQLEERFHITITINADDQIGAQTAFAIERGEQVMTIEQAKALVAQVESSALPGLEAAEVDLTTNGDEAADEAGDQIEQPAHAMDVAQLSNYDGDRDGGRRGRRRRRRRGRGGGEREQGQFPREGGAPPEHVGLPEDDFEAGGEAAAAEFSPHQPQQGSQGHGEHHSHGNHQGQGEHRRRRRGRRGGRRNRRERENYGNYSGGGGGGQRNESYGEPMADGEAMERPPVPDFAAAPMEPAPLAPTPEAAPPPSPIDSEPPRRRSTVREPVTAANHGSDAVPTPSAPPPAAIAVDSAQSEGESAGKPRRTGWWAKRFLGDKG